VPRDTYSSLPSDVFIMSILYRAISQRLSLTALSFFSTAAVMPSSSKPSPQQLARAAAQELVDNAIAESKITVFSKSWCGYCRRAKSLLREEFPDVEVKIFELDERLDESAILEYLIEKTGQHTVPNVFINSKHIGGSDKLAELHRAGKLAPLVAASRL